MIGRTVLGVALGVAAVCTPAWAAEDQAILRMAACQDSWLDWNKTDPDKLKAMGEHFRTAYEPHGNDAYYLPKAKTSIAGMNVTQIYPGSVGMGVGLSVTVDAPFDKAKTAIEDVIGKKLTECESGDGMRSCGLQIAEKRNVMVMTGDNDKAHTLVGCYYYYEK